MPVYTLTKLAGYAHACARRQVTMRTALDRAAEALKQASTLPVDLANDTVKESRDILAPHLDGLVRMRR